MPDSESKHAVTPEGTYMLGPVTIIMLDASDRKVLLAYKTIEDAVSEEATLSFFLLIEVVLDVLTPSRTIARSTKADVTR